MNNSSVVQRSSDDMESKPKKVMKHKNAARINDTIWFGVILEASIPIEQNTAARNAIPMYEPITPGVSILPGGLPRADIEK